MRYIRLDEKSRRHFLNFLPAENSTFSYDTTKEQDTMGIGIYYMDIPCGALLYEKTGSELRILHLETASDEIMHKVFRALKTKGVPKGVKSLRYDYVDTGDDQLIRALRSDGFERFGEQVLVYRIDALTLGGFLRFSECADRMFQSSLRLMGQGRVYAFSQLDPKLTEPFAGLEPEPEFSFCTLYDGAVGNHVAVSSLPDGSLYLSDINCPYPPEDLSSDKREEIPADEDRRLLDKGEGASAAATAADDDFWGLLYMALGKVYMKTAPEGEFYVVALSEAARHFTDALLERIRTGLTKTRIVSAWMRI